MNLMNDQATSSRRLEGGQAAGMVEAAAYGPAELSRNLRQLQQYYPCLEMRSIGRSVLGKKLWAVTFGRGSRAIHVNAACHANEWITSLLLMRFLEDLGQAYTQGGKLRGTSVKELYEEVTLWAVPMVNPDGVELVVDGLQEHHPYYEQLLQWNYGSAQFRRWKANARGVDLNDQFPAHWEEECRRRGTEGPGPRDYPGESPLSEPEAQSLAALTRTIPFELVVALHTQGQEIYWNYRDCEPPEAESLARRLGNVSGYKPVKLTGSDAGYKDWFIQQFRKPGFTVEAGYGVNPLSLSRFEEIYDEVQALLVEVLRCHRGDNMV
ncbi:M14 family metallocarboxypeptidase [Paenibacillus sp. GCM10023252]|uniref:M14 family metallopeptidase n=1 Tax=Paenibacillus sp. GCM10023252 TaxID=3252649 RepID=UPI0036165FD2